MIAIEQVNQISLVEGQLRKSNESELLKAIMAPLGPKRTRHRSVVNENVKVAIAALCFSQNASFEFLSRTIARSETTLIKP